MFITEPEKARRRLVRKDQLPVPPIIYNVVTIVLVAITAIAVLCLIGVLLIVLTFHSWNRRPVTIGIEIERKVFRLSPIKRTLAVGFNRSTPVVTVSLYGPPFETQPKTVRRRQLDRGPGDMADSALLQQPAKLTA